MRGQYSPSTKTLFLGLGAPTYKSLKFIINSSGGIESFGGLKYLDSVENTIGHELRHKLIYDTWPTLTAASDFDGDWVPNDFENGTLTTAWEPQGQRRFGRIVIPIIWQMSIIIQTIVHIEIMNIWHGEEGSKLKAI